MESCKSIIEATATRWRWMTKCWRLRLPVREALLAPEADTTESVMTKAELEFWKKKARETDKALKESKEANKALVHFIHTRNTPDVDLRAVKKAMATVALAFLPLLAMSQPLEPYRHNFFTTNPAPVVDVTAGTNVFITPSLVGTGTRHFKVDVPAPPLNQSNAFNGSFTGDGTGLTNLYVGLTAGRIPVTDTGGILVTVPTLLYDDVLNQMIINENAVAGASSLVGTALSARGADNAQIRIGVSSFGIAGAGAFAIRHARGTAALPTAISTGDQIMSLEGWGYGTTGYGVAPSVTVRGNAADLWTDTSMPSYITFRTTPTNSLIPVERMRIDPVGVVSLKYDSIGTSIVPDLWLTNSTAAALGAQQNSPALMLGGQGWRSGNSTTHSTAMGWYTLPVQGSSADPTARMTVVKSVDGVAPTSVGTFFESAGGATIGGALNVSGSVISSGNIQLGGNGYIYWNGRSDMYSPAIGDIQFMNGVDTSFSRLFLGPQTSDWLALKVETTNSPTLSIRTGNDGNYASLVTSNITSRSDALAATITPSLWLTNATAAALGAQQNSPALMLGGQGWRSGNSTTHSTAMGLFTLPIQGSAADPTMRLTVATSINGGAPTSTGLYFDNAGTISSPAYITAGTAMGTATSGYFYWNGRSQMFSPANGDIQFLDILNTTFSRLFLGPQTSDWLALKVETTNSPTLSIRTGNDAQYASLVVSNVTSKSDALGASIIPSVWLTNSTAAALGAQQNSPALMLGGQGWRNGNSTTHSTAMGWYTLPVQGSSADPTARLTVVKSVDGVAPTATGSWFDSQGTLNLTASATTLQCTENDPNSTAFQMNLSANGYTSTALLVRSLGVSTPTLYNMIDCRSDASFQTFVVRGDGFTSFGPRTSDWPSLKVETTNSPTLSIRTGNDGNYASLVASNITASGSVTATNNYIHQFYQTNGFTYCNSTNEYYLVNAYTNPLFVLPDASTVKGQKFEFTTTNQSCFFIVTNKTGTQTIANGSSLSYTNNNNGQKVVAFISDGAHWWLATKGRTILPSASWSCNTNITFPNVTNMVTLDTQEANNGVGITLDNSAWTTVGVGSRIWVTNAGMYLLTFSAMWAKTGGGSANGDVWIRQDGTMIPRTMTLQTIQNATSTNVMTVNFILPVTKTTYFDLVGASPDGTAHMQAMPAITSPFARPAAPSIIVTMQKTSD